MYGLDAAFCCHAGNSVFPVGRAGTRRKPVLGRKRSPAPPGVSFASPTRVTRKPSPQTTITAPSTFGFTRAFLGTHGHGIPGYEGWLARQFACDGDRGRLQDDSPDVPRETHGHTHALTGLSREGGNVPALWARSRG